MKKTAKPAGSSLVRHTLTHARDGINLETWELSSRALQLKTASPWSIRKFPLRGGRQDGVELLVIDNGRLRITLIPTRGMGILRVESEQLRLGWDSPVQEVVHPHFIHLPTRGGLGWLEGFNEWLVRCGLENCGGPGRDSFVTNTGAIAEMDLTLHGRIANIPASEVEVVIDRKPPHRLCVRGRVEERMFYGPKLELWTEVSTEPGASTFRVTDTVANRGASEQEFQLLYHLNFGPPLLEAGARFAAPLRQVTPMNDTAAQARSGFETYAGPTPGFVEQVYCLHPLADAQGFTTCLLHNAAGDRGASLRLSTEQLPYLTLWKSTGALADGYVTGIEPATGFPHTRRIERSFGRVPKLAPGQAREFGLEVSLHSDRAAVRRVAEEIARIQAGRPVQRDAAPVKLP